MIQSSMVISNSMNLERSGASTERNVSNRDRTFAKEESCSSLEIQATLKEVLRLALYPESHEFQIQYPLKMNPVDMVGLCMQAGPSINLDDRTYSAQPFIDWLSTERNISLSVECVKVLEQRKPDIKRLQSILSHDYHAMYPESIDKEGNLNIETYALNRLLAYCAHTALGATSIERGVIFGAIKQIHPQNGGLDKVPEVFHSLSEEQRKMFRKKLDLYGDSFKGLYTHLISGEEFDTSLAATDAGHFFPDMITNIQSMIEFSLIVLLFFQQTKKKIDSKLNETISDVITGLRHLEYEFITGTNPQFRQPFSYIDLFHTLQNVWPYLLYALSGLEGMLSNPRCNNDQEIGYPFTRYAADMGIIPQNLAQWPLLPIRNVLLFMPLFSGCQINHISHLPFINWGAYTNMWESNLEGSILHQELCNLCYPQSLLRLAK